VDNGHRKRVWHVIEVVLLCGAAAGWLYVIVNGRRQKEPMVAVKKHFLFYPEYSHGVWREGPCGQPTPATDGCRGVTYTVPVKGCGTVTFDWRVFPQDDGEPSWMYNGTRPKLDEAEYPLYALLSDDGHFIDSPALGKALPDVCAVK